MSTNKWGQKMRDGSSEYKLGRLGRHQFDFNSWDPERQAEYQRGVKDAQKRKRAQRRVDLFENVLVGISAVFLVTIAFIIRAIIIALPFLIIMLVAWVLFF